jgi:protein-disulfide isomerase
VDTNIELPADQPEPQETSSESSSDPVAVIPRETFNYVVIAVVFLALGLVIGVVAYDRIVRTQSEDLIKRSVAAAVAALPASDSVAAADPNARYTVSTDGQPSLGPADAPIVMVEFGDFRCSYCKRFHDQTVTPLLENYGDQIRFVYRDYPILGPDSLQAALAASCAYDQNAFWDFHDRLYANPQQLTRDAFLQYATELDLNVGQFTQCYDNAEHQEQVVQDYSDGEALGISGTPTFFINGRILVGAQPYEQFVARIDAELNELTSESTS